MTDDDPVRTATPRRRRDRSLAYSAVTRGRVGRRRTPPLLPRIARVAFLIPPDLLMGILA